MITIADLHQFIIGNPTIPERGVFVKINTIESHGLSGTQIVDVKKLEVEDDGSLTIIVEST